MKKVVGKIKLSVKVLMLMPLIIYHSTLEIIKPNIKLIKKGYNIWKLGDNKRVILNALKTAYYVWRSGHNRQTIKGYFLLALGWGGLKLEAK